jgi:hypothetical protein
MKRQGAFEPDPCCGIFSVEERKTCQQAKTDILKEVSVKGIIILSAMAVLMSAAIPVAAQEEEVNFLLEDCVKDCNTLVTQEIKSCDELYDMANEFPEHTQCLSDAQERHDDCVKTCHENYDR